MSFCVPLVTALVSAGLQEAGAQQAEHAANRATGAEIDRQAKYRKEAQAKWEASLKASTPEAAKTVMDAGTQQRNADYAQQQAVPLTQGATPGVGGTQRVVTAPSHASQDLLANAARARLSGYTEWDLQQGIKDLRAEQALSQISNFSRGSENILPMELNHAAHSGDSLASIGSLIGLAGSLYGGASAISNTASPGAVLGDLGAPVWNPAGTIGWAAPHPAPMPTQSYCGQ